MRPMTTLAPTNLAGAQRGRPAARWAVVAAHLAPLLTLPSFLWRFGLVLGASMGVVMDGAPMTVEGWEYAYVIGLALVSEATALLTIGLVRPWGERAPAWMPLIGGRRVRSEPVIAVALCQGSRDFLRCDHENSPPVIAGLSEAMAAWWARIR